MRSPAFFSRPSRRGALAAALAALLAASAACGSPGSSNNSTRTGHGGNTVAQSRPARILGDGSQADTGPQPNQPKPAMLTPGQKPPQFVVFSWDGAGEDGYHLFSHFLNVAERDHANMTFFLSGIYMLPPEKRDLYDPPGHPRGSSAINFLTDQDIRETIPLLSRAWLDGDDIGTHFNGHFCGASGVGSWSVDQWRSEIQQAYDFVEKWRTNTGFSDLKPLPFDYATELKGARTPCLEGQKNEVAAAKSFGWTYDASSPGGNQVWPTKIDGLWNFPLQLIPFAGHGNQQLLSMDYNLYANQSAAKDGDPAMYPAWQQQAYDSFMAGFNRAYTTNRAPLFIGNHFEQWNGGIYMKAVEQVADTVCTKPDVRCVSFAQMADWLDAQNPGVVSRLQQLNVGQTPDWNTLTTPPVQPPAPVPSGSALPNPGVPGPGTPSLPPGPVAPPGVVTSPKVGVIEHH